MRKAEDNDESVSCSIETETDVESDIEVNTETLERILEQKFSCGSEENPSLLRKRILDCSPIFTMWKNRISTQPPLSRDG
jgi:hypothetical protein